MSEIYGTIGEPVVAIEHVTRRFGTKLALDNVTLRVPRGSVFGLIGGNGAGKTTLIKHMLGMLRAQSGRVRVLGQDPVEQPAQVLAKIGYLSEERDLPNWMRVRDLIRYKQAFYPSWDPSFADSLQEDFSLNPRARVATLSRGERARLGLLLALAHRPEILILDEPSSGLDPVVRRDILGAIIRTVADEGRTVFFSSHLLDEVERVADSIAILHQGRILVQAPIDEIKESHRRFTLRFDHIVSAPPQILGRTASSGSGSEWTYTLRAQREEVTHAASASGATVVEDMSLSLDEIFVEHIGA